VRITILIMLAATLLLGACSSDDKERIEAQNTAAAGEGGSVTPRSGDGDISVFDLREGHCLTDDVVNEGELEETGSVRVVACDSPEATGQVSSLILMPEAADAPYPGTAVVEARAEQECAVPGGLFTYFIPIPETWENGDRTITCVISLGFDYAMGDCVADADAAHRITDCAGDAVFGEVADLIDLTSEYPPGAAYPGDPEFDEIFSTRCAPSGADYYVLPSEETWQFDDRLLVCVTTIPGGT
jgi:hypothetical protein